MSSLEIVYSHFYQDPDTRLSYHCDLLTRGMGGVEMESRKGEEWASQLQCWSLQLINCFAFKPEFLPALCKPEFLVKLPVMWGGLVNENSPAGIGLLRTICQHKLGRGPVSACSGMVEALCNIARSSDDWQYMAIECLLWLLQDPNTSHKVVDKAFPTLVDLAEITNLGDHKKLGDSIVSVLQECKRSRELIEETVSCRQRLKWEKNMPKEDLHIKQAAALVVKLEGNSLFSSGDVAGAAEKYSEALSLCPMRSKKERVVLYSNRAQCHLLLQQPLVAISDATHALSLHNPVNRHAKSLWRRAQAYDITRFLSAERLVKKQMKAGWLFKEAALKHGGVHRKGEEREVYGNESDDSEWETASGSDNGDDGRHHMGLDDEEEEEEGHGEKWKKRDKNEKTCSKGMRHGYNIKLAEEDMRRTMDTTTRSSKEVGEKEKMSHKQNDLLHGNSLICIVILRESIESRMQQKQCYI
ncbi:hypothetical protein N665_0841s0002 [Sinapis alba]|nr:hypothetical protein N665_0841s0002 [Sinapis alba]